MTNTLSENNTDLNLNNNNTSIYLLNDLKRTKTLIDEANIHIKKMKKGEYFKKTIKKKVEQYKI